MNFLKTLFSSAGTKALVALSASVIGLVALFTTVAPSTAGIVAALILAIANVGGVFVATNK